MILIHDLVQELGSWFLLG